MDIVVVNMKDSDVEWDNEDLVYIGRGDSGNSHLQNTAPHSSGWLGNPFSLQDFNSREEVIDKYATAFLEKYTDDEEFKNAVDNLIDRIHNSDETIKFGCWCAPKACHGDFLKDFIETNIEEK